MVRTHGVTSTYTQGGCRCRACTEANTASVKARTARRTQRLAADPGIAVEHGKVATYRNWGCRCEPCTAANTAAGREPSRRHRQRRHENRAVQP